MGQDSTKFIYKEIDEMKVVGYRAPLRSRKELPSRFQYLRSVCGDSIIGNGIMILRYDTGLKDGFDVEVAFPISGHFEDEKVRTHKLDAVAAMSYVWKGHKKDLQGAWNELNSYANSRGMPHGLSPREVYIEDPMDDTIEVELQATFHDWDVRFKKSLEEVLGSDRAKEIMEGYETLTPHTNAQKRAAWAINAISKLESHATETQKYEIISQCAHVRPMEEILKLKEAYDRNKDVDEFLEEWGNSLPFKEKPYREGNIIYQSKPPANPDAYEKAENQEELIKATCFCPIIQTALDRMPRAFCYCGAGWSRQMYETVFGTKLKIEVVETVIDGGKLCKYAIHLPPEFVPD